MTRGLEAHGVEIRPGRARPLARRFALAHGSRLGRPIEVMTDMAASRKLGFPRLPEHRGRLPRPVRRPCARRRSFPDRAVAGSFGGRRGSRSAAADARRIDMDSGEGAPGLDKQRFRDLTVGEGREDRRSAASQPNRDRMTEHELLRIIAFLERVRLPFQELVPIAEEDATWNMLLFLDPEPSDGKPGRDFHPRLGRQGCRTRPRCDASMR